MRDNWNPFTGEGNFPAVNDTPYKGLKLFLTEDYVRLARVQLDNGISPILIENEESE